MTERPAIPPGDQFWVGWYCGVKYVPAEGESTDRRLWGKGHHIPVVWATIYFTPKEQVPQMGPYVQIDGPYADEKTARFARNMLTLENGLPLAEESDPHPWRIKKLIIANTGAGVGT